jgi:8-amino-7-oxononanoate synthase
MYEKELESIEKEGLLRTLRSLPACGGKFCWNGKEILNFSSNDYLNLAGDPRLKARARQAIEQWGCGATASRLMSGHLAVHEDLEADLARMVGGESSLVFGSGFLCSLGVLTSLVARDGAIFADRLNHASLVDGSRLSGAKLCRYRHRDMNHLEHYLARDKSTSRRLIVSDSVFSMDGDIAPLRDLFDLAHRYDALLVIDEAHAIGVMGHRGGGVWQALNSNGRPDVILGTMSKALGSYGGFAVCSTAMRSYLINRARSFIYSTAIPPACAASTCTAIMIIETTPDLGKRLLSKAKLLRDCLVHAGLDIPEPESQIIPICVGETHTTLDFSQELLREGILAAAVRPPTVPPGTSRLRLSVTLAHTDQDLEQAAVKIGQAARNVGVA